MKEHKRKHIQTIKNKKQAAQEQQYNKTLIIHTTTVTYAHIVTIQMYIYNLNIHDIINIYTT